MLAGKGLTGGVSRTSKQEGLRVGENQRRKCRGESPQALKLNHAASSKPTNNNEEILQTLPTGKRIKSLFKE